MCRLLHTVLLSVATVSTLKESEALKTGNLVTTKMISKLVEESSKSVWLFIDLNSDILDNFVKSHNLAITVEVSDLSSHNNRKHNAVILHLRNFVEFQHFFSLIRPESFFYDGHFIILYDRDNIQEIEKIFAMFWKVYIYNVNVLVVHHLNSTDSVRMFTHMPFAKESCHNTRTTLINEFNETTMTWSTNIFFPNKFRQMNRCPIRYGCYQFTPAVIVETNVNGSRVFSGLNVDILRALSEVLNFTALFVELRQEGGIIFKNKTATGMLQKAIANEVDLVFSSLQQERVDALSATRQVYSDKIILVVPPPFLIDPMTKMFLPFNVVSWTAIGVIALLACCCIKILKFTPTIVYDYVVGANVKGSMLNVFNVFLGGAQQVLPKGSFPRFLLANFLIFTLIIRTLYQGEVFKLLKRDVRTVQLNTIDEFVEHKFTFYIYEAFVARLQGTKMMERLVNGERGRSISPILISREWSLVLSPELLQLLVTEKFHYYPMELKMSSKLTKALHSTTIVR